MKNLYISASLTKGNTWYIFRENNIEVEVNIVNDKIINDKILTTAERNYFSLLLNIKKDKIAPKKIGKLTDYQKSKIYWHFFRTQDNTAKLISEKTGYKELHVRKVMNLI